MTSQQRKVSLKKYRYKNIGQKKKFIVLRSLTFMCINVHKCDWRSIFVVIHSAYSKLLLLYNRYQKGWRKKTWHRICLLDAALKRRFFWLCVFVSFCCHFIANVNFRCYDNWNSHFIFHMRKYVFFCDESTSFTFPTQNADVCIM